MSGCLDCAAYSTASRAVALALAGLVAVLRRKVVDDVTGGGVDVPHVIGLVAADGPTAAPTGDVIAGTAAAVDLLADDAGVLAVLRVGVLGAHRCAARFARRTAYQSAQSWAR